MRKFKSFKSECIDHVLSYHDSEKIVYNISSIETEATIKHERIHEQIFSECSDGQLLASLIRVHNNKGEKLSNHESKNLIHLIDSLFDCSEKAQEVFATYLGVKALHQEKQLVFLNKLPPLYHSYYITLSESLDNFFSSSYLQYLFGWNMASIVFSSRAKKRFIEKNENPLEDIFILDDLEKPNIRLSKLQTSFKKNFSNHIFKKLQDVANTICNNLDIVPWDIDSEAGWIQNAKYAAEVEVAMSHELRPWLFTISKLPALLFDNDHEVVSEKFNTWIDQKLKSKTFLGPSWKEKNIEKYKTIRGNLAAKSKIQNSYYRKLVNTTSDLYNTTEIVSADFIAIVTDENSQTPQLINHKLWNVFAYTFSSNSYEFRGIPYHLIYNWMNIQKIRGGQPPFLAAVICKINSITKEKNNIGILNHYFPFFKDFHYSLKFNPLFYCIDGDWLDLFSFFISKEQNHFQRFNIKRNKEDDNPFIIVHILSNSTGYYFKIFPFGLSGEVSVIEDKLIAEKGAASIKMKCENLPKYFVNFVINHILISWKYW